MEFSDEDQAHVELLQWDKLSQTTVRLRELSPVVGYRPNAAIIRKEGGVHDMLSGRRGFQAGK
ncbi:hypothetical protein [Luteolibacter soli]|uniref:Uncharacterized protein n=1 Tax=Luteolibacter soli TaxID=3135280 RepID=A0ABU9B3L9_9BACT